LLYAQDGILDDTNEVERALGIKAGLCWGELAEITVVYTDLGITDGMNHGIEIAKKAGREIIYRKLDNN